MRIWLYLLIICLRIDSKVGFSFTTKQTHSLLRKSLLKLSSNDNARTDTVSYQEVKLKAQAATLRAEVARLEALQKDADTEQLARLFASFDKNNDGNISVSELQEGLTLALQSVSRSPYSGGEVRVTEEQANKILNAFDVSGDGSLQFNEFPSLGVEAFKRRLDTILREEEAAAARANEVARQAKKDAEVFQAIAELINNEPPTGTDRLIATLPYFLPLADSVEYSRSFITTFNLDSNPLVAFMLDLSRIFEAVPFSGLGTFFLFSVFARNLKLNRLVRFSIQQAIYLDIALIAPGIAGSVAAVLTQSLGVSIPEELFAFSSTATFVAMIICVSYSVLFSALGIEPNGIPIVSDRAKERVPSTEEFQKMVLRSEEELKNPNEKKK